MGLMRLMDLGGCCLAFALVKERSANCERGTVNCETVNAYSVLDLLGG